MNSKYILQDEDDGHSKDDSDDDCDNEDWERGKIPKDPKSKTLFAPVSDLRMQVADIVVYKDQTLQPSQIQKLYKLRIYVANRVIWEKISSE